ncbi:TetR/AcrR family transcriptional regulator [Roseibium sp.]|uniref:TetR/AcrR family transcriptional regulator n=1 Tax=Roseibium sp. TaxID=1936156 RepID=UPI003BA9AEA4
MVKTRTPRLNRSDWIAAALSALQSRGVENIKIVNLAKDLGVTSGSFYWHFKDLGELLRSTLEFWEIELTDRISERYRSFDGNATDRLFNLMVDVIRYDAAAPDHAISVWAKNDDHACQVYERTLQKRFDFARWMFEQNGFEAHEAQLRGRLFVAYLMGESSTNLKAQADWEHVLKRQLDILTARPEI